MLFAELAVATEDVRGVSGRLAKVERLAAALGALDPEERVAGASYLAGSPRQRVLGVGWASLRDDPPPPAAVATLSVAEVDAALAAVAAMSGAGSVAARRAALNELMARATASEQAFLRALVLGDIRQGALAAVVGDAVAKAAGVPVASVRRAVMLRGDLGAVAAAALGEGEEALAAFRLEVGRPIAPMLAQTAPDVEAALAKTGPAAVEWKLDGARIQVHRDGEAVGDLHAHARRRHGTAARGGRGGVDAAGAVVRARRRGDRAARGRPAAPVPGHRAAGSRAAAGASC